MSKKKGSRFVVDLGDIEFSPLIEKKVEAEIQSIVLRALAETDFGGKQAIIDKQTLIRDDFEGRTVGMWIGDPNDPKPPS